MVKIGNCWGAIDGSVKKYKALVALKEEPKQGKKESLNTKDKEHTVSVSLVKYLLMF